jgi:hypothetical protein
VAVLAAWQQGWPWQYTVAAQPRTPRGQMTWAFQFSLLPTFFDPAETPVLPPVTKWFLLTFREA